MLLIFLEIDISCRVERLLQKFFVASGCQHENSKFDFTFKLTKAVSLYWISLCLLSSSITTILLSPVELYMM